MCTLLMPLMCLPRRGTLSNYFTKGQKLSTPSTFQENTAREEQILLTTPHFYLSCTFQHQRGKGLAFYQKHTTRFQLILPDAMNCFPCQTVNFCL